MQMLQHSDAARLAGLTPSQMREWCGRRGVVEPDVAASGRGRHALYSWQTILALRILKELRDSLAIEVGSWGGAMKSCQEVLQHRPFHALWGMAVFFTAEGAAHLVPMQRASLEELSVFVPLDKHLEALSGTVEVSVAPHLPLFSSIRGGQ
jgi:DNA-binding transcriptional MerR regulator